MGEQLAFEGERYAVVVGGGAALNLLGIVERSTTDVDILAFAAVAPSGRSPMLSRPPDPLPAPLRRAIAAVARDTGLDPHWMNTGPALQWQQGLPPRIASRLTWQHYGPAEAPDLGLRVGLVSRYDLVFFKPYAAAEWVAPQNASPEFHAILREVVAHARQQIRQRG